MTVDFKTNALRRCYEKQREGVRRWGEKVARLYVNRVDIFYASQSGEDLYKIPQLRFHALKGKRKGEYALRLDEFWRLVVSFREGPPSLVRVEEVSKHYGD